MDFSRVTTISFDCYGTLIDWESGILPVLRALMSRHGQSVSDAGVLELFGEFEALAETGPYQSYRDVLRSVVRSFADRFNFQPSLEELNSLHESVENWLPFSDTVLALRQLKKRYRLAVISNIDDDLFAETRKLLEELLHQEEKIDVAARQKIESQKRTILEGSQEWDILYRKYYNEEVKKLGV